MKGTIFIGLGLSIVVAFYIGKQVYDKKVAAKKDYLFKKGISYDVLNKMSLQEINDVCLLMIKLEYDQPITDRAFMFRILLMRNKYGIFPKKPEKANSP